MFIVFPKFLYSVNYRLILLYTTISLLALPLNICEAATSRPIPLEYNAAASNNIPRPVIADTQNAKAIKAYKEGKYKDAYAIWLGMAKNNDGKAMNNLGILYEKGLGVKKSLPEAAEWFKKSAEAGHLHGMNNYAKFLKLGYGTIQNEIVAAQWFRIAAEKGLAEAQFNLALLYDKGVVLSQNSEQAVAWYSRAATQNQPQAQTRLGQMYAEGRGVDKNISRATLLLYGASMHGELEAIKGLEDLAYKESMKNSKLNTQKTTLFGEMIESTNRNAMRKSLEKSKIKRIREDNNFICDVYDVKQVISGATEMALCYGADADQNLGFVKINYNSPNEKRATQVVNMVQSRFGSPSAKENDNAVLWNLGKVIVATQYSAESKETGLMYIVPRVYHLTKKLN